MTCPLDRYLLAVAKRKPINRKTNTMNYAIVSVIEDDDIPRMIEIITELKRATNKVIELGETASDDPLAEEMAQACAMAHLKTVSLAEEGDLKKWGGTDGN